MLGVSGALRRAASVLAAAVLLAACDVQDILHTFEKQVGAEDADKAGRHALDLVRTHQYARVAQLVDPRYRAPDMEKQLGEVASYFPQGAPLSVKTVGVNENTANGVTEYALSYEYEYPHQQWRLASVILRKSGKAFAVEGINIHPASASLEQMNAMTLAGKTPVHYLFLVLAIFLPLFTIATAVVCYRTPIPRLKWLWVVFTLVGVVSVAFNWTTAQYEVQPISFVLLGVEYSQALYGPAVIKLAFPLGAVLFWLLRRRWVRAAATPANT